jgi:hypothetical protein
LLLTYQMWLVCTTMASKCESNSNRPRNEWKINNKNKIELGLNSHILMMLFTTRDSFVRSRLWVESFSLILSSVGCCFVSMPQWQVNLVELFWLSK